MTKFQRFQKWLAELPKLSQFNVPRCVKSRTLGEVKSAQIHHFSDASELGYGSVSYLRLCNADDKVECSFLMAKSHLPTLKVVTIPRLELSAATVSIKLDKIIKREEKILGFGLTVL